MENSKVIKINGHYYLKIDETQAQDIITGRSSYKIVSSDMDKKQIDQYWDKAAKDFKRELFMNTVRPLLKESLGLNYSELKCEEKAKLLCQKYYEHEERGEKYTGPYLL